MQPGAIVREAWELYKGHWRTFVPLALIVYIVLGLVTLVFALLLGWLGAIIGGLASIVGTFWLQGALVEAVQDVRDGKQDLSIGELFQRVQPRLPALIVAGILAGLGIALGLHPPDHSGTLPPDDLVADRPDDRARGQVGR